MFACMFTKIFAYAYKYMYSWKTKTPIVIEVLDNEIITPYCVTP